MGPALAVRRGRWAAALAFLLAAPPGRAEPLAPHEEVTGPGVVEVQTVGLRRAADPWRAVGWDDLESLELAPGHYVVRLTFDAPRDGEALQLPPCAGAKSTLLDGRTVDRAAAGGPLVVPVARGTHSVALSLTVSPYEKRVACGARPRVGGAARTIEGLAAFDFDSPHRAQGGGRAVAYVPAGHDPGRPSALLVGAHPWNGTIWTYAAYATLLAEARARDVVLLMPSGLGNSLYTAEAEDEVLRAVDALAERLAVDPRRVSLWGASMGGAGATTVGLHHPDRFASVTSFFGDSRYDLTTYVRPILVDERGAHQVDALDVVDNARSVPVWLVHGVEDRTSPVRQSDLLAAALEQRGFAVRYDRVPGAGHSGALVARFLAELVQRAAAARVPDVTRVSFRSVSQRQRGAYGVTLERASPAGDAFVDVERRPDGLHVTAAEGLTGVDLAPGALGVAPEGPRPPVLVDCAAPGLKVRWGSPP